MFWNYKNQKVKKTVKNWRGCRGDLVGGGQWLSERVQPYRGISGSASREGGHDDSIQIAVVSHENSYESVGALVVSSLKTN